MGELNERLLNMRLYLSKFISSIINMGLIVLLVISTILLFGLSGLMIFFILYLLMLIIFEITIRVKKSYYVRKISDDEYKKLLGRKLIHYSNRLTEEEYRIYLNTGKITIKGSNSAKSNYVMKIKEKNDIFVWFHPEDKNNSNEPELYSFLYTHLIEKKRKYKVIVNVEDVDRNRLYIRPDNGNILVKGDLETEATIDTSFNWYTDKFYLKEIVLGTLRYSLLFHYYSYHRLIGRFLDKIQAKKGVKIRT